MRLKIIAGNLAAVLVVGVVSYFVVSSQLRATLLNDVDSHISSDYRLFERSWRLSGLEFEDQVAGQADQDASRDLFAALDEQGRRRRANERAGEVAEWFARRNRDAGRPEVVVVTDSEGIAIARNHDLNRMHGDDLKTELTTLRAVLQSGEPAIDVWAFSDGQQKLLQAAMAPIRDVDGEIIGSLVVGYDMSNGMAQRAGDLLGRQVAFLTDGAVYSSSLDAADALRTALFTAQQASTEAALAGGPAGEPWLAELGGDQYIGVTGALPLSPSTHVAYVVLADRSAQLAKASAVNTILVMTAVGLLIVLIYGFLVGTTLIKPIEQMEEGILAVINGRTDMRLDIHSAELGGLAYRINQLLNVFTGTPEEDEEGRVSSPPEAWGAEAVSSPSTDVSRAAAAASSAEEEDPELAAKLEAEPEDAYYDRIYQEYVSAKEALGENVSNITKDRFVQRLQANEKSLLKKHGCRLVRFQVQTRGSQVNLRPVIIR